MKITGSTLFFLLTAGTLFAQLRGAAKLHQDTLHRVVLIIVHQEDSIVFREPNNNLYEVAFAGHLDSIIYKNGEVFHSLPINNQPEASPKILQRLETGATYTLYHRLETGEFFIRNRDGQLWSLGRDKAELRAILTQLTENCPAVNDMARQATPKPQSLSVFIRNLNRCRYRLFPSFRVGVTGGIPIWRGRSLLPPSDGTYQGPTRIDYGHAYLLGVFGEIPITALSPNLYLRSELYYSGQDFRVYHPGGQEHYNLRIRLRRLEMPFQVQYVFTVARFHPFLGVGGQYLYNFNKQTTEAIARPSNGGREWAFREKTDLPAHEIGLVVAGGMHLHLGYRRLLTLQARYHRTRFSSSPEAPSGEYFTFQTGINF